MTGACRLPPLRWLVLLAGLACSGTSAAALNVQVQADGLDHAQLQASERLVDDALARLPVALRESASLQLALRWRDDLPEHVVGRARGEVLGLDRSLLTALTTQADDAPAWQAARAALLHELAHALDRSGKGGWSKQSRFLDLAGWPQRPLWPGRGQNRFSLRSPDRYELDSPAEFFAVNFEHYLLDPGYRCRRPALYQWYAEQLGVPGQAEPTPCAAELPLFKAGEQEGSAELLSLDPARIYQVDYLLAEGNDKLMSRWGHSMLRLVVCAPGRAPGPACRMDLQHHLVLSFRAFVGDVQISSWRGLTGSYPSRLFVLPLDQVVDEYTKVELRGLSSTPLALTPPEVSSLLQQAAQLHWSYDGRYFFISNNCAVETGRLLQDGVPRLADTGLDTITPTGLLKRLRQRALLDAVPADRAEAIRRGYYFESAATHYAQVFQVARAALPLPAASVEQWLALPAARRREWMPKADGPVLAALLLLEQAAARRHELHARDLLKRRLLTPGQAGEQLAQFRELMDKAGLLLAPGALPLPGYGIPGPAERGQAAEAVAAGSDGAAEQWRTLRAGALALLPESEREQGAGIQSNMQYLRQRLRLRYGTASPQAATPARGTGETDFLEKVVEQDNK